MNTAKFITGLIGIGGLGFLAYYFSKKAEEAAGAETLSGEFNPLDIARREARELTQRETDEFYHLWGIHPNFFQGIENWDYAFIEQHHVTRPTRNWALVLIPDLRHHRNINWSYVSDFYTQFPQYSPEQTTGGNPPGWGPSSQSQSRGGELQAHWSRELQRGDQTLAVRREIGRNKWRNLRQVDKEMVLWDFYCVLHWGWDKFGDVANGKATLIGLGGFRGFVALWQPPSSNAIQQIAALQRGK